MMSQNELFSSDETKQMPRNQFEAVVYFIANLDIEMVSTFLDDNKTYQALPKYLFISKLISAFSKFQEAGDTILSIHKGSCAGCIRGCSGYTFLGKQGHFMDLIFILEDTTIMDIYECESFECVNPIANKIQRVVVNEEFSPFSDWDDDDDEEGGSEDDEEEDENDLPF